VRDLTAMQYYLLSAHLAIKLDNSVSQTEGENSSISEEESNKMWESHLEQAHDRAAKRKVSRQEVLEDAQKNIIKHIEEKQKNGS